jgi:hypothetical protein
MRCYVWIFWHDVAKNFRAVREAAICEEELI